MTYFSVRDYMIAQFDRFGMEYAFDVNDVTDEASFYRWQAKARARLWEITGMNYCLEAPLEPKMLESTEMRGYTREKWLIQTEPSVYMPFYLLRPENPNGKAMLNPHGHGGGKENSVIDFDDPQFAEKTRWGEGYAIKLAREGYFVACPDARGSGERREAGQQGDEPQKAMMNSHREINQMALGFGQCMVAYMVWDLMRLIDFLYTMPEIDKEHIGCFGMSGGGQQTLFLAALDDRVKVAVTSGYFYGYKEALMLQPGNCSCNFVPHIWRTLDHGDLGAMIAPRALLVESGRKDGLNGAPLIDNVLPQVDIARRGFAIFNAQDRLHHSIHDGGPQWVGTDVLPFLEKWL